MLAAAGVPDAASDLRRLERAFPDAKSFDRAVRQRAARKPLSQIVGRRAFWTAEFLALSEPFARVLDLGTGSGCILISLLMERPGARGVGTDISDKAVLVAGENAARLGVADRIVLPVSDWFADVGGRYDLIVSNPPYIAADEMAGLAPEVRAPAPVVVIQGRHPPRLEQLERNCQ